jgi:hypothetical protein
METPPLLLSGALSHQSGAIASGVKQPQRPAACRGSIRRTAAVLADYRFDRDDGPEPACAWATREACALSVGWPSLGARRSSGRLGAVRPLRQSVRTPVRHERVVASVPTAVAVVPMARALAEVSSRPTVEPRRPRRRPDCPTRGGASRRGPRTMGRPLGRAPGESPVSTFPTARPGCARGAA